MPSSPSLPANEYEYPANAMVPLSSNFTGALDPSSVVALNTPLSPSVVSGWLD